MASCVTRADIGNSSPSLECILDPSILLYALQTESGGKGSQTNYTEAWIKQTTLGLITSQGFKF